MPISSYTKIKWSITLLIIVTFIHTNVMSNTVHDMIYNPNITGSILNVAISEPALLPLSSGPSSGMIVPLPLSGTFELSNSEFTLYNPIVYLIYKDDIGTLMSQLLYSSFNIEGLPASRVSTVLCERLSRGVDFTCDADYTYFQYAGRGSGKTNERGFAVRVKSYTTSNLHIPGDAFKMIFSNTEGLQKGNSISLSSLESEISVISDISLSFGMKTERVFSPFDKSFAFSWGVTSTYKLGHMMLHLESDNAQINYSENNIMSVDSRFKVSSVGMKINEESQFEATLSDDGAINGHGAGISGGVSFASDNLLFAFNLNNLGFMSWNSTVNSQNIQIHDDSLFVLDLQTGTGSQFTSSSDESEELFIYSLNSSMSMKISYFQKLRNEKNRFMRNLSQGRAISLGYLQPFKKNIHNKRPPHFFLSLENEMFNGNFPVRVGWDYQNQQNYSSFVELQQVGDGVTISLWYRAQGDMLFRSAKGGEIGITSQVFIL